MTIKTLTSKNKDELNGFLIKSVEACDYNTVMKLLTYGADNRVEGLACANSILMSHEDGESFGISKILSKDKVADLKKIIHLLKRELSFIKTGDRT